MKRLASALSSAPFVCDTKIAWLSWVPTRTICEYETSLVVDDQTAGRMSPDRQLLLGPQDLAPRRSIAGAVEDALRRPAGELLVGVVAVHDDEGHRGADAEPVPGLLRRGLPDSAA